MFRTVKAMTAAGIIAAGLPLLTETASAQQVDGWNLVRPHTCVFFSFQNYPPTLTIYQANSSFAVYLVDSLATSTLLKMCNDGSPFYAFWDSYWQVWTYVETAQSLQ
jgi:hypothetical protein